MVEVEDVEQITSLKDNQFFVFVSKSDELVGFHFGLENLFVLNHALVKVS